MLNNSNVSYFRSFVMTKIITRAFPVSYRISLVYAYINFSFRHAEEVCLKSKKGHSGPFCSLQKHSFSHSTFSYPSVVLPASLPLYHPKTGRYRQHGDRHRHISASMPRHQSYRFCSVYCSHQLQNSPSHPYRSQSTQRYWHLVTDCKSEIDFRYK